MPNPPQISTRDLGRMPYGPALALQRELNQQVIDRQQPPTLLLVEHDPVITLTRRKAVRDHLLADEAQLARLGIQTHETDRGGDITYHGPGQLVIYPILPLAHFNLNLSSYMRLLEQAVIDTIATWGIQGHSECGATGVWVGGRLEACGLRLEREHDTPPVRADSKPQASSPTPSQSPEACGLRDEDQSDAPLGSADLKPQAASLTPPPAKLCAMGVRIRKNTTMHGLALNINPDLTHFDTIIPCGLAGRPVTSMKQLLGDCTPSVEQVKNKLSSILVDLLEKNAQHQSMRTSDERWLLT